MKITLGHLKQIIREEMEYHLTWPGDTDPRQTPHEKQFVDGPDELVGYIIVSEIHGGTQIATAPITRTDGPDRPYLVRTTDTKWHIPFWAVRLIYPGVQDTFNAVDSHEDWRSLGPGSGGRVGEFRWLWVLEPQDDSKIIENSSPAKRRRRLKEAKIGASAAYDRDFEEPKRLFEAILKEKARQLGPNKLGTIRQGSPDHLKMIEEALDEAGIFDPGLRALVGGPFKMVPPHFLLRM